MYSGISSPSSLIPRLYGTKIIKLCFLIRFKNTNTYIGNWYNIVCACVYFLDALELERKALEIRAFMSVCCAVALEIFYSW